MGLCDQMAQATTLDCYWCVLFSSCWWSTGIWYSIFSLSPYVTFPVYLSTWSQMKYKPVGCRIICTYTFHYTMEMFSRTDLEWCSVHPRQTNLLAPFNCGDDGALWSLILTLMQSSKSRKGIVEMLYMSQLFFHTSQEKDTCKVRLHPGSEDSPCMLLMDKWWIEDSVL